MRRAVRPRAGEVYRSPVGTTGRYRYIRVDQVRCMHGGYVTAHEVLPSGKPARGKDRHGMPRNLPITIMLVWSSDGCSLPRGYEAVSK